MYEELIAHLRECAKLDISNNTYTEAADAIEELQAQLMYSNDVAKAIAEKVPRWIPVTERLPCLTTPVLATDGIEVDISWMYGVPPRWITSFTAIDEDKLTHWMPLPQTPKGK